MDAKTGNEIYELIDEAGALLDAAALDDTDLEKRERLGRRASVLMVNAFRKLARSVVLNTPAPQPAAQEPRCPLCHRDVSYYTFRDGQWAFDCDNSGCGFVQVITAGPTLAEALVNYARITGQVSQ